MVEQEKKVMKKSRMFQPTVLEWSRYLVLDECLRDQNTFYKKEDLLNAVNRKLERHSLVPVSMRTLDSDLNYMKSEEGFNAQIVERYNGHKKILTYKNPHFSIMNLPMTDRESDLLSATIAMLGRFRGLPNYRWLDHTLKILRSKFNVHDTTASVTLDQNEQLRGLDYFFEKLYEACKLRLIVKIEYLRFDKADQAPVIRVVEPYQMREWNNRWYLVGHEQEKAPRMAMVVVPIDRIEFLEVESKEERDLREERNGAFVKPSDEKIDAYFKDVVGLSRLPEGKPETVKIKAWGLTAHFIETKPIHWSQKEIEAGEITVEGPWYKKGRIQTQYQVFEMKVIPNEPLIQALLVYGNECEVIEPRALREKVKRRAEAIVRYNG